MSSRCCTKFVLLWSKLKLPKNFWHICSICYDMHCTQECTAQTEYQIWSYSHSRALVRHFRLRFIVFECRTHYHASSGVLLKMEVGICKGRGKGPEGTLLIYDHWGEYTLSKKTRRLVYGVYPRIPPNTPLRASPVYCQHCGGVPNSLSQSGCLDTHDLQRLCLS